MDRDSVQNAWEKLLADPRYPVEKKIEKQPLIELWISLKITREVHDRLVQALVEAKREVPGTTLDMLVEVAVREYLERNVKS